MTSILRFVNIVNGLIKANNEAAMKDVVYELVDDNEPTGGFRIYLVVEATAWNKAIRIYNSDHVDSGVDYCEVKAGDSTGKQAKSDPKYKYDTERINWPKNDNPVRLCFMKPATFGVWTTVYDINIPKEDRTKFGGKSLYIYWSNDGTKLFSETANRLKKEKIV
ncbi:hypothetical protein RB653_007465 [Dictyostelium firmibasis]|uniref:Uncharacterized protein n=1 Tax=Dictyostelium firmibasis TaxID=79012 RepID=A0AAN7TNN1_9MYCE